MTTRESTLSASNSHFTMKAEMGELNIVEPVRLPKASKPLEEQTILCGVANPLFASSAMLVGTYPSKALSRTSYAGIFEADWVGSNLIGHIYPPLVLDQQQNFVSTWGAGRSLTIKKELYFASLLDTVISFDSRPVFVEDTTDTYVQLVAAIPAIDCSWRSVGYDLDIVSYSMPVTAGIFPYCSRRYTLWGVPDVTPSLKTEKSFADECAAFDFATIEAAMGPIEEASHRHLSGILTSSAWDELEVE